MQIEEKKESSETEKFIQGEIYYDNDCPKDYYIFARTEGDHLKQNKYNLICLNNGNRYCEDMSENDMNEENRHEFTHVPNAKLMIE